MWWWSAWPGVAFSSELKAVRHFWRILVSPERTQWVVLGGGAILMAFYVYQGHHSFFTAHLAEPLFGDDAYNDWYRHLYQFLCALLLLGLVPALLARFLLRRSLAFQGVRLGDWRFGLLAVGLGVVLVTPLLYLVSLDPEVQSEYPLTRLAGCSIDLFVLWQLSYLIYYIAWEYFFRGFTLFLLEERWGPGCALLYQIIPSTLLHIGKPQAETFAAIFGGILFAALALRTRSMLYPLILHWYVGACTDLFSIVNMTRAT